MKTTTTIHGRMYSCHAACGYADKMRCISFKGLMRYAHIVKMHRHTSNPRTLSNCMSRKCVVCVCVCFSSFQKA